MGRLGDFVKAEWDRDIVVRFFRRLRQPPSQARRKSIMSKLDAVPTILAGKAME